MIAKEGLKYQPDWDQPVGKISKREGLIRIHPFDLIPLIQKKRGFDAAGIMALKILKKKYDKLFDDSKLKERPRE